ncbi:hypothetical protein BASA50_002895 [Batrachochytrium salamandrivorans]|uniref:Uncharacterized protein n=1 Tax=Batrachochytrium salamandrivorans TaxID=1357716 RepID=A0ABQ8FJV5_9FUNG|nr:hypothetical protein BASA60_010606 [Batrachochytrium salamandrivorans]KAH6577629.1 hypothetical protein BASA62_000829 [Batrachochytrium salamandrivorans]KAH6589312.1 hypothetical protein BASA61_005642 [Batrachochytrium salamandrivorans]KAH6599552.1 hypothetical protein BASA50_002895 [Batrachochytrium salamandrivorans]KAH9267957.1 hypothetical protein BASA84_000422 [Batrachochytrium salamandrivorans]
MSRFQIHRAAATTAAAAAAHTLRTAFHGSTLFTGQQRLASTCISFATHSISTDSPTRISLLSSTFAPTVTSSTSLLFSSRCTPTAASSSVLGATGASSLPAPSSSSHPLSDTESIGASCDHGGLPSQGELSNSLSTTDALAALDASAMHNCLLATHFQIIDDF